MKAETLVITKEGWKVLIEYTSRKNCERLGIEYKPFSDRLLDKQFSKLRFRNSGASNKEFPIADNEFRYCSSGWNCDIDTLKTLLMEQGLPYRSDGFVMEYVSI